MRPLDPWPHSEAGRFHRVIALLLVCLGALILVIELARHHSLPEAGLAGPARSRPRSPGAGSAATCAATPRTFPSRAPRRDYGLHGTEPRG